jgi:hypothetical protein
MDNTKPVINAMAAAFFALGEAMGGSALQRAGVHLRELVANEVVDKNTAAILEGLLVGIDHDASPADQLERPEYRWWEDINALAATAH